MLITGKGVDYISIPIIASFATSVTNATINIPVTKDNITEESETFDLSFAIPLSLSGQVIPGKIATAVGKIVDDSGKTTF